VHADPHILDRDKRVLAGFEFFHVKMTRQPSLIYDIDGFCVGLVPDRLMRSIVAPTRRKRKRFQVPFGGAAQAGPPRRVRSSGGSAALGPFFACCGYQSLMLACHTTLILPCQTKQRDTCGGYPNRVNRP
jgi:hypothetical protein